MTEAMPFLQKYDITFLRPPTIVRGVFIYIVSCIFLGTLLIMRYCPKTKWMPPSTFREASMMDS